MGYTQQTQVPKKIRPRRNDQIAPKRERERGETRLSDPIKAKRIKTTIKDLIYGDMSGEYRR